MTSVWHNLPYYVVEGPDGSGKGTVVDGVMSELVASGLPAVRVTEPSDGHLGLAIRQRLSGDVPELPAFDLQRLFVYDRHEHLDCNVMPSLQEGTVVVSDRSALSTCVYGSTYTGRLVAEFINLHREVFGDMFLAPRLTVVLRVSALTAYRRVDSRGLKRDSTESRLGKVIDLYDHALHDPELDWLTGRRVQVSAEPNPAEVRRAVWTVIKTDLCELGLLPNGKVL